MESPRRYTKKATTGQGSVVDVSLLGLAAWNLSPDVAVSQIHGGSAIPKYGHADAPNPLVGNYRTKDDRYVKLMMLQLDKFYPGSDARDRATRACRRSSIR